MEVRDNGNPFELYQNTGYRNDRKKIHNIVIKDDANHADDGISYNLQLQEPLRIDKLSDVYLDSFTTYNIGTSHDNKTPQKQHFVIDIDQFNIKTASHTARLHNKLIIPNEDGDGDKTFKVHKGRKMNYVGTVNPCVLTHLSGKITDGNGGRIFQGTTITVANLGWTTSFTITVANGHTVVLTGTNDNDSPYFIITKAFEPIGTPNGTGTVSTANANNCAAGINAYIGNSDGLGEDPVTATVIDNVVTITGLGGHDITGTAVDAGDITINVPHFLAEFVIIEQ